MKRNAMMLQVSKELRKQHRKVERYAIRGADTSYPYEPERQRLIAGPVEHAMRHGGVVEAGERPRVTEPILRRPGQRLTRRS